MKCCVSAAWGWNERALSRLRGDGMGVRCLGYARRGLGELFVRWVDDPEPQRVFLAERGLPGLKPSRFGGLFPRAEARGFYRLLAARGWDEVLCLGCVGDGMGVPCLGCTRVG